MSIVCVKRPYPFQNLLGLAGLDALLVNGLEGDANNVLSLVLSGVALITLGLYGTLSKRARALPHFSLLRFFVSLYCLLTGIFFFVLVTQLNKVVIILAGLHNLVEWGILSCLIMPERPRTGVARGVCFIWLVWLAVMLIPDTLLAFLAEEIVGIWPDFILLAASWWCWFHPPASSETNNRRAGLSGEQYRYRIATQHWAIGATFHMIQIFTLLLQGISFISPTTAMIFTYLSVLPNYYYYTEFGLYFDGDKSDPPLALPFSNNTSCRPFCSFNDFTWLRQAGRDVADPQTVLNRFNEESNVSGRKFNPPYSFWGKAVLFGGAFLLALAAITGPFVIYGMCPHVGAPCADHSGNVWQMVLYDVHPGHNSSVVQSLLEDNLRQKHSWRGNLYHAVFVGEGTNLGRFLEVEKWFNQLDLNAANRYRDSKLRALELESFITSWSPLSQVEAPVGRFPWLATCDSTVPFLPNATHTAKSEPRGAKAGETTNICRSTGVTGFTIAQLQHGKEEFALNALSRGLISREEDGNQLYYVFSKGADVTSSDSEQAGLLAVVEQWSSLKTLRTHMETDTVHFIQGAALRTAAGGGVLLSSPFVELFAC